MNEIRRWLENAQTQALLTRVARSVVRDVLSRRLCFSFLKQDSQGGDAIDCLLNEIRSELALFLLENRHNIQKRVLCRDRNCQGYIKTAFVNYWIEKTRGPHHDRHRYLYKRTGDLLRASDSFYTLARRGKPLVFSMVAESASISPLSIEDIGEITFPAQIVDGLRYESINKKKILLGLATYFWKQVSRMWGCKPVWVEVRSLIDWIGLHVSTKAPTRVKSHLNGKDLLDDVEDSRSRPDEKYFNRRHVEEWAHNFSNQLSQKEKAVLYYLHSENELTQQEIAQELGYKGPSGLSHPLKKAEKKLRFFLRDLAWLSPDDLNEEAFALFSDTLFSILKKSIPEP